MLNKNKILMLAVMGAIANLPSNTNAQTFYQCMPCQAGTYYNNGSCTKCPAGTYSQETGATSSNTCRPCPDYQWSDAGSTYCNTIRIPVYYFDGNNNSKYKKEWLLAGQTYTFSNDLFGGDISEYNKKSVGLGQKVMTYYMEDWTLFLDCKKLPCENLPGGHHNRLQRILSDGTIQYNFNGDSSIGWNNGDKVTWDD